MASKRKQQTRTVTEKYEIMMEIDKGMKYAAAIRGILIDKGKIIMYHNKHCMVG